MIRLIPIASGSSGNCIFIELGGHRVIADIGVSYKMLSTALKKNGFSPDDAEALMITHTHSDHVKGLDTWRKKSAVPIFASGTTLRNLCLPEEGELPYYTPAEILPGMSVTSFRTSHDCMGSAGFLFRCGASSLGIATDLGFMGDDILQILSGAENIIIESNHDVDMLRYGKYPYPLKRRILSESGHLSNADCAEAMKLLAASGTKHFFLAHLSRDNNTPELALASAHSALDGTGADVQVLPVYGDEMISPG